MADKLEILTNRLEKVIGNMSDKLESQIGRLEKALERLEAISFGPGAKPVTESHVHVQAPKETTPVTAPVQSQKQETFSEFNSYYNDLEEKAKATGNQDIIELTNIALHTFKWTDAIIGLSSSAKKPSNETLTRINQYIGSKAKEIDEKFLKPRKIENHAKTVKEGLGACLWILTEAPVVYIDGVIEPTVYNGNKVKVQKVAGEPEWVDKFVAVLKAYKDYAKEHHQIGLTWKGKTEGDFSQLLEGKITTGTTQVQASPSKPSVATRVEEPKPVVQSQPVEAGFTEFNNSYNEWEEKAKATANPDIIELTNIALHIFKWSDAIIGLAGSSKKPSNEMISRLNQYVVTKAKEIDEKFLKPRKIENHAKTVKEGVGAALWILVEAPVVYLDGVIEPTTYNANKVKWQKITTETEWVDKLLAILKHFKDYIKEHYQTGLIWKGKTEGDFTQLLEGKLPSSQPATSQHEESKSQKEANAKASLFAELNKGSAITQGLKVAERKPKGQVSSEAPLQPLQATSTHKPPVKDDQPKVPVNKPPNRYLKDNWFIENYVNDRTIVIDDADMRQSIFIDNCHKCLIQVKGKVKGIVVSKCSSIDLIFDTVVSTVEAVNTNVLNIQATNHAPSIVLDKCERVKVYLAKNLATDVVSSKVTELNISYLQDDGDFAKEFPVTEQFVTRWDPNHNKFVTKPMDLFIM